ncbi:MULTISPECIES: polymorphic toxin-type HINT domain-containing protein [unclassified Streptomyces]|uniref:polymorphic toxin-type HINT domain-containing protein n=1 Tax=unclassified Streptomyces TaxID=2593676 RepID=UPI0029BF8CD1|nr:MULTISPECIES: polymorphic toxin-type HINT domain-containing protein [unclassified Streptomyces]MDX3771551.1 polymorphic toxin-type HINT domain-containing protein [Streptomyces sp. AK08-01B]MDX3821369.1 polymorphic toxin-type HINT domain-containing protein [Streptomyces sp. AK08-01A]
MGMKRRSHARSRIAIVISTVLVGTLLQGALTSPAAQADDLPNIPASEKSLTGHGMKLKPRKSDGQPRVPEQKPKHAWPEPGTATITLPSADGTETASDKAGALPVTVSSLPAKAKDSKRKSFAGKATVRLLDEATARRAAVDGPLLTVTPAVGASSGDAQVTINYSTFAQTYGGAYARRLQLVQLPACAITTPHLKRCAATQPVSFRNDPKTQTLTATSLTVRAADSGPATSAGDPVVLAVTAGTSSDKGDYTATSLSPSATWSTNLNTGDFTWSYDIPVPGTPGKFAPKVGLSYASGGVDGRTVNTNNQGSWVGDGFGLGAGSIDRSYKPCADDNVTNADGKKPGDLCWAYDNATISFNGHAGELIPTSTANTFKIKGDDGTKVARIFGDSTNVRANGDNDDEYWRVTTTDGTRYYFGYNRLEGWASGDESSDSTWTVPVYGNDANEPCHGSTFEASWCQQAWRWNLDYAVDVHGNAIAYYYDKETNYYARNLKPVDETAYIRGGSLDRIEYGLSSTKVYTAKALAKVDFTSKERCLPETGVTCDASTIDDKKFYWYDTPWDLNCKSGEDCTKSGAPSFWTRLRLTDITTQVLKADGTYAPIDSYALNHRWGMADTDYQLLLESLQHTGKSATPEILLPKVTFGYDQRPNRPDVIGDDLAPFIKERLSTVSDESGGQIDVAYSVADCSLSNPPTPQTNTTRCFPVYANKPGFTDPQLQWFNKYVVDAVTQTDRTTHAPDMVTRYDYLDGAAWHFDDDDGMTKEKYKTWSSYRGYGHVRVRTGGQDPVGMKSQTDHYFLRGMDGDKAAPSGGTKTVEITDDNGNKITDHSSAAGFEYKSESYSGPGGKVLAKTLSTPWHYETAKRVRSWGTTTANLMGTLNTWTFTSLDDGAGGSWRKTYDSYSHETVAGRVTLHHNAGDTSSATDNQCTRTTYSDPGTATGTKWILTKPARVETTRGTCTATPNRATDAISDVRTAYDGGAYAAAPTKGDATRIASLQSHDGTTATYLEASATFDDYGRELTSTDLTGTVTATENTAPVRTDRSDGRTTTVAYTPTTGFPTTMAVTTPPATAGNSATAQTSITTYEPLRGLSTVMQDPNTKRTETTYDALGRKLKIWLPNRSKANDLPNYEFSYTTVENAPVAVGTKTLKSDAAQWTSYTLFDGFLRPRQSQAPGTNGGRIVTDTFYDERGLTAKTFAPYYNDKPPAAGLLELDDALLVETQAWNTYDGLGRITQSKQIAGNGDGGQVLATTITAYSGDRVTITPPKGATPTTTFNDAQGRTTELWQYPAATPTGTPDKTYYSYEPATGKLNPTGKLTKLTDPAGNLWTYEYDQRGNLTDEHDPDKGHTHKDFNDRNQLTATTDQRGKTVAFVYDNIGRELETHDGAIGPLLTKKVWDPTGYKGQLASATRYEGGDAYTTTINLYDTLYRPKRTTVTIPATAENGALAGSYQTNIAYNTNGTIQSTGYPAAGALPAEVITPTYDDVLRQKTLVGTGGTTYVTDTAYSLTGKPLQYTLQSGAKFTQVTNSYEWGTQRLHSSRVDRQDVPGVDKSASYAYDEAGNIHAITDVSRDGTDNQCFQYDSLSRLTEAWTQNTDICLTSPSSSVLGGPAPYWQSYGYDKSGNRLSETLHDPTGNATKDTTRSYTYPPSKSSHPHSLTQVQTTGPNGTAVDTYTYDDAGNTETRTISGDKQTLIWDADGQLNKITEPDGNGGTKTTAYVYDTDGTRLIRRTDSGTTLYLGATEITLPKGTTTPTAQRYYDLGGGNQAIRTNDNKVTFLIGDHHNTSELAVNAADLTMQQRRSTPFGAPRGKAPATWPGEKGFIGGTRDATTGLTHLGAREYDPTTGRFISVDPVLDASNPQQLNGYSYTENNPTTFSDPTGRSKCDVNPELCGRSDNTCDAACVQGNIKAADKANKETQDYFEKKKKKDLQGLYDYFFKANHCYGNPYNAQSAGNPANWTCLTQAEVDARDDFNRQLLSALGDMTILEPWYQCAFHGNQEKCDTLGEAISTFDLGGVARGGGRLARMLYRAQRALCSFTPDTRVLLKGGKAKPIGKVKPGEKVEAANPRTGKHVGARGVTARLVHRDADLIDLTIRRNGRNVTLHTTARHPFWDNTAHGWVAAGRLTPGHALNAEDGSHAVVVNVAARSGSAEMYNLTVEQLHTFYVVAGDTPVLVHNSNLCATNVALGARDTGTIEMAVDKGWTHYMGKIPGGKTWQEAVMAAIDNPNVQIHVNTEGFRGGFSASAVRGMSGGAKATEEEMAWLAKSVVQGKRSWSSITFYDGNGDVLPLDEPAWSTDPTLSKMWLMWGPE